VPLMARNCFRSDICPQRLKPLIYSRVLRHD
jgi:hypothetical protein